MRCGDSPFLLFPADDPLTAALSLQSSCTPETATPAIRALPTAHLCGVCSCKGSIPLLPDGRRYSSCGQQGLSLCKLHHSCMVLHGFVQPLQIRLLIM